MQTVELSEEFLEGLAGRLATKLACPPVVDSLTFGELFEHYFERHTKTRNKRTDNTLVFFNAHGQHWKDTPVHQISRRGVQEWVDELGAESQSSATRAVNMLSAIINWGIKRELLPSSIKNPCVGVDRFDVESRERFLSMDEISRLRASLAQEPSLLADFFWICLLTGARKSNVLAMQWSEVDRDLATWTIDGEDFKNGHTHVIALTPPALAILNRRFASRGESLWVFPGQGKTGHLIDPKRAWLRVLERAKILDCRLHDLRRTMGSWLAIGGANQFTIAKMLGHKDLRSTAVYARLDLAAVREAATKVTDVWNRVVSFPEPAQQQPASTTQSVKPTQIKDADRVIREAKILTALRAGGSLKKHVYRKFGGQHKISAFELDRILIDMIERKLITKKRDDRGLWRYALFTSEVLGETGT
jgi:integrase